MISCRRGVRMLCLCHTYTMSMYVPRMSHLAPHACTRLNALELSEAQQSQLDLGRLAALAALLEQLTSEPEIVVEIATEPQAAAAQPASVASEPEPGAPGAPPPTVVAPAAPSTAAAPSTSPPPAAQDGPVAATPSEADAPPEGPLA